MDFAEFFKNLEGFIKVKNWSKYWVFDFNKSKKECSFKLKSNHTGADFYGKIRSTNEGMLEISSSCKESKEIKGKFEINTIKKSSVEIPFYQVFSLSNEEKYDLVYNALVYLKREYRKNFN